MTFGLMREEQGDVMDSCNSRWFVGGLAVVGVMGAWSARAQAQINSPGAINGMVLQYQSVFTQASTSPPVSTTTHTCLAFVSFDPSVTGIIDSVDVLKPGSSVRVSISGSGTFYSSSLFTYTSRSSLMSNWPNGEYTFIVTDDELDEWEYPLQQPHASGVWPAAIPAFTPATYTALQGMDPTQPRLVEVNTFTVSPPATGQLSGLLVSQRFGTLQGPTAWSSLTTVGSPTSTRTIPANTLLPNTDYFATWYFDQRIPVSYPPPAVVEATNVSFGNITRVAFRTGAAAPACVADVDDGSGTGTPDGGVTIDDLIYYLGLFESGDVDADVDDGSGTGTHDGGVTIDDLIYYLTRFEAGC